MEMAPSGVLKYCDGKEGRLFIVLPPDPLLLDWSIPRMEETEHSELHSCALTRPLLGSH